MGQVMSHFEVVRTAQQQWHVTLISRTETILWSENYTRMVGAERAILAAARIFGWGPLRLVWNVEGIEKVFVDEWLQPAPGMPTVRYIDDRLVPVKRPDLPPLVGQVVSGTANLATA